MEAHQSSSEILRANKNWLLYCDYYFTICNLSTQLCINQVLHAQMCSHLTKGKSKIKSSNCIVKGKVFLLIV